MNTNIKKQYQQTTGLIERINKNIQQAHSQVWIWKGGAFLRKVDFFAYFLGQSGLLRNLEGSGGMYSEKFLKNVV